MIYGKSLNGKPMYGISDGVKVGEIKDLYLTENGSKLVAMLVQHEGLLTRRALVVNRTQVAVFGQDAWLLRESDAVMDLEDIEGSSRFIDMSAYRGREVHTSGGTTVGTIGDVIFRDAETVAGFALDKVSVDGPIAERKYIVLSAFTGLPLEKGKPAVIDMPKAESFDMDSDPAPAV